MAVFDVKISRVAWRPAGGGVAAGVRRGAGGHLPRGLRRHGRQRRHELGVPKSLANALSSTGCTEICSRRVSTAAVTIARNLERWRRLRGYERGSDRATPIDPAPLAVLDGGGTAAVLTTTAPPAQYASSITAATVIEGLTIRNGKASWGGGVYRNASLYSTNPNNNQRTQPGVPACALHGQQRDLRRRVVPGRRQQPVRHGQPGN